MSDERFSAAARRFLAWRDRAMQDETAPLNLEPAEKAGVLWGDAPSKSVAQEKAQRDYSLHSQKVNARFSRRLNAYHALSARRA